MIKDKQDGGQQFQNASAEAASSGVSTKLSDCPTRFGEKPVGRALPACMVCEVDDECEQATIINRSTNAEERGDSPPIGYDDMEAIYLQAIKDVLNARTGSLLRKEYAKRFQIATGIEPYRDFPVSEVALKEARDKVEYEFWGSVQALAHWGRGLSYDDAAAETHERIKEIVDAVAERFEMENLRTTIAEAALKRASIEEVKDLLYDAVRTTDPGSEFLRRLGSAANSYWAALEAEQHKETG